MATKKTSGRKRSTSGASEYVREEMHEVGKGRVKNPKQAIAIGLSRARRAGEDVPPPKKGKTTAATRKKAESDYKAGRKKRATKKTTAKKTAIGSVLRRRRVQRSERRRREQRSDGRERRLLGAAVQALEPATLCLGRRTL